MNGSVLLASTRKIEFCKKLSKKKFLQVSEMLQVAKTSQDRMQSHGICTLTMNVGFSLCPCESLWTRGVPTRGWCRPSWPKPCWKRCPTSCCLTCLHTKSSLERRPQERPEQTPKTFLFNPLHTPQKLYNYIILNLSRGVFQLGGLVDQKFISCKKNAFPCKI